MRYQTCVTHSLTKTLNTAVKMRSGLSQAAGHAQAKPLTHADLARSVGFTKPKPSGEQQLQTQANNLIGQTFFATLLKQMHDSPFKSELFDGGHGGEAFRGLYDQKLAQHMAQKAGTRLTRPIVKKYKAAADAAANAKTAKAAYGKQADLNRQQEAHESHDRRA